LLLFSAAAVGGLLAISPKYAIRQAGVEQKAAARAEVARRQQSGELSEVPDDATADPPPVRQLRVPLWTLAGTIVLLVSIVALSAWKLRKLLVVSPGDERLAEDRS
jgi:hypothetical protein